MSLCPKWKRQGSKETKLRKPRLVIVSAPSGAGKTTLCDLLLKEFPGLTLSVSATTRAKRPNEQNAVHYHFISKHEFEKKIKAGDFAEWAEVHDNCYGTLKSTIKEGLKQGKHILFDIDVKGAQSLLKSYPDRALLIFVHPPSIEELTKRLTERRSDSAKSIERRLANAYNEVEWSKIFDYQITNDNLQKAFKKLKTIIQRECL